ncbi:MAG: hypothetical protein AB1778_07840, partial [Candidatus Bipolaricaulota bacterium]
EVTVFARTLDGVNDLLKEDAMLGMLVSARRRNGEMGFIAEDAYPLKDVAERSQQCVTIVLDAERVEPTALGQLREVMRDHPGPTPVLLELESPDGDVLVRAASEYCVAMTTAFRAALVALAGVVRVALTSGGTP